MSIFLAFVRLGGGQLKNNGLMAEVMFSNTYKPLQILAVLLGYCDLFNKVHKVPPCLPGIMIYTSGTFTLNK